jgi:hypothetical protein
VNVVRIRLIPLAIASVAMSVAVIAAVAFGTALLPVLKNFALGVRPGVTGASIAVVAGVVTAVLLVAHHGDKSKDENARRTPRDGGPADSPSRTRER